MRWQKFHYYSSDFITQGGREWKTPVKPARMNLLRLFYTLICCWNHMTAWFRPFFLVYNIQSLLIPRVGASQLPWLDWIYSSRLWGPAQHCVVVKCYHVVVSFHGGFYVLNPSVCPLNQQQEDWWDNQGRLTRALPVLLRCQVNWWLDFFLIIW